MLLGVGECFEAKKQSVALMRPQTYEVQPSGLPSLLSMVTPYPVKSSLSLTQNLILFFLGSDELLATARHQ